MPLLPATPYSPPFYLFNRHLETIVPSTLRKVALPPYERERFVTPDDDFLDLDWLRQGSGQLVIISHGLEGSSDRPYVKGMAKVFWERGWDVLAWNCRSCSGEMNRAERMYHHGATDDLAAVVEHVRSAYSKIALTGFSMGGSMTLKYLGEMGAGVPKEIYRAAVFSVPCDLGSSARALSSWDNTLYRKRFMRKLYKKLQQKLQLQPHLPIDLDRFKEIKGFPDFDTCYTAPLHGFKDSADFYAQASSGQFIPHIQVPTLLANALNDPMLPLSCFPVEMALTHPYLYLEMPRRGGHVGFSQGKNKPTWAEVRALAFITEKLS
ncbi:YheT family hydrolase [Cesiribacter andamanensis]|uniref:Putative hydrolase n=1 Tax=Cesiribacter andamanensis AMV16 TaxID=1279009 RepID=M7NB24_9BACT|nr:alpha/beta fold hydrolase [Cesiribacter andamanensis]EMR04477.1 putative hydrolase [Cesiribacter andamanensis AMV16]